MMEAKPPTSPNTQTNDTDRVNKMEDEHFRLQRQVRMIQTDREHRTMGVHPQFRTQDQLMRILKMEYIDLIKDLKIASKGAHKKKDNKMKIDLKRALMYRIKTTMESNGGLNLIQQLEELLQRNKKNTLHLRKIVTNKTGQINERRIQSENRLVSTENRLEVATLRFNVVQHENMQIREEIEHMLKDRALFNQAWSKMLASLNTGKKFLTDLFESSTLAYDQRDEWCTKLHSVQEKAKLDQLLQLQEMRDLQKTFDHEMKLYNFLAKKGVMRINMRQEEREEQKKLEEEQNLMEAFQAHSEIITEITNYTEEKEIQKIIDTFLTKEQENFSIYKLLTDHCAENVVLDKEVKRIRQEVEDRRDWNENMEAKKEESLQQLTQKLDEQKMRTDVLRSKVEEKDRLLQGTMGKIEEIFEMLDCSDEPFQNLLGDKRPSLRQFSLTLQLITEKIEEYLQIVYYNERYMQKTSPRLEKTTSRLKKYTVRAEPPRCWKAYPLSFFVTADPCPACVEARWLSRVSETPETPFDSAQALRAIAELSADPAYLRSDRVHPITDCRVPGSRVILAARYLKR